MVYFIEKSESTGARSMPDAAQQAMIYIKLPVGVLQCNCSIVGDPVTREAIVIDPGDEVERILDLLGRYKLSLKAIISTHAHMCYWGRLASLEAYPCSREVMHRVEIASHGGTEAQ